MILIDCLPVKVPLVFKSSRRVPPDRTDIHSYSETMSPAIRREAGRTRGPVRWRSLSPDGLPTGIRGMTPKSRLPSGTIPAAPAHGSSRFSGKNVGFRVPEGPLLFSDHSGLLELVGSRDRLPGRPVFAHFQTLLNCTVFSRLKRVFLRKNDLNKEFFRLLAPFPLPNFFGIRPGNLSVGE